MKTLPYPVARMIHFSNFHPVTAWRIYLGISKNSLASSLNLTIDKISEIEKSNLHLKKDILQKLTNYFNIDWEFLNIRYQNFLLK